MSLDVRHADDGVRDAAVERLSKAAAEIAARRGLDVAWERDSIRPSVVDGRARWRQCSIAPLEHAGTPVHRMTSGAGHDAMIAGGTHAGRRCCSCAVPGGISHHPDESVREDDVAAALEAGVRFSTTLAGARP